MRSLVTSAVSINLYTLLQFDSLNSYIITPIIYDHLPFQIPCSVYCILLHQLTLKNPCNAQYSALNILKKTPDCYIYRSSSPNGIDQCSLEGKSCYMITPEGNYNAYMIRDEFTSW